MNDKGNLLIRTLQRAIDVKEEELSALFLSCAFFFFLFSSYYVLRPIRDEMGVSGGVENLPWLFTGTMVAMLAANPLFSALVVKFPVKRFISIAYRFFIANLIVFFILLKFANKSQDIWIGRAFFVWTSVFNLFAISVFWALMADLFRPEQSKRLFGFIGVGGTFGSILGSTITAALAKKLGPVNLLLVSALLLEVCVQCVRRFRTAPQSSDQHQSRPKIDADPIGGDITAGIIHTARSPYLLGISLYKFLYTIGSTFLYFQQASIVAANFTDRSARTAYLGKIDLAVNILTVLTQLFLTGRIVKWLGVSITLGLMPAISAVGFAGLGAFPTIAAFAVFQVVRRAGGFALSGPVREVLFTTLSREDKYKAKNFIDTFVYRVGDQVGAWSNALLSRIGLSMSGISLAAVPISLLWLSISLWLGRKHTRR